jgi:hypothetical protein
MVSEPTITEQAKMAFMVATPLRRWYISAHLPLLRQPGILAKELSMTVRIFVAFSAVMLFTLATAFAQDVNGNWQAEFDSQIGQQKYTFMFTVKGDKLTGKAIGDIKGEKRETEIQDGKVKGADISFVEPLKIMDMEIKIEYIGKIMGDEIKLKRKVGDFAEYDITLKRVKPATKKASGN